MKYWIALFLLIVSSSVGYAEDSCRIFLQADRRLYIGTEQGKADRFTTFDVGVDIPTFNLSADHSIMALDVGENIDFYRIEGDKFTFLSTVPNVHFVNSSHAWFGHKIVLYDQSVNWRLNIYDVETGQLTDLSLDAGLQVEVLQLEVSPNGRYMAFFGHYHLESLFSLYVLDLSTLSFWPLSTPDEQVDWHFVWVDNDTLMYSYHTVENTDPTINIRTLDGQLVKHLDGDYLFYSMKESLLRLYRISPNPSRVDIFLWNTVSPKFEYVTTIPANISEFFSFSDDFQWVALWLDHEDGTVEMIISNLHTGVRHVVPLFDEDLKGSWHPFKNEFMILNASRLYMYVPETGLLRELDIPPVEFLHDYGWICP